MNAERTLDVYLHGTLAGVLVQGSDASLSFTYRDDYRQSADAQIVSVSMPFTQRAYPNEVSRPFFSGLLPDESARVRLARALGLSDSNAFGMLEIIGGDCAGALALFPHAQKVSQDRTADEVLSRAQLESVLQELRGNPLLASRNDVRLSLAGAQDKIAVNLQNDSVVLVKNGSPTTHILKPAIQGLKGTAQNEVFCMMLAKRVGFQVPHVRFSSADDTDYILIERFDRVVGEHGDIRRLHQEDFCQAMNVLPELKYEDEGGPGIERSMDLIQRVSAQPAADKLLFLKMQIFHFLVGNADAHAKNYALLHSLESGAPSLAPLYDVVCTAAYPALTKRIAMSIGARNVPDTIRLKHWLTLVPETKVSQQLLMNELRKLATSTVAQAEELHNETKTLALNHPVLLDVLKIIKGRAKQLIGELDS